MARVGKKMASVDSSAGGCQKLNCQTSSGTLNRHHRRHQKIWMGVWELRRRGEEKFKEFCKRYNEFHPDDWCMICLNHHAEIHLIYDRIIRQDQLRVGRALSKYSWTQAEKLMDKLEAVCVDWLKKDTPGVTPERLDLLRDRYYNRPGRDARKRRK